MLLRHSIAAQGPFLFVLSGSLSAINLRTAAIAAGWNQSSRVIATVASGARIASVSTLAPAMTIDGVFPGGAHLILESNAWLFGRGGEGASQKSGNGIGNNGLPGHHALVVSVPVTVTNNGIICPGGGGGGSGGGANASSDAPLIGGKGGVGGSLIAAAGAGSAGTNQSPLPYGGGTGGNGGMPSAVLSGGGDNGTQGYGWINGGSPTYYPGGTGGNPGDCVRGNNYIAWLVPGTRYGFIRA